MENKIKNAAAAVEANIERYVELDQGSRQLSRHLDDFERDDPPLARETTIAFLFGTVLVALLVAAGTWLLLSESPQAAPEPPATSATGEPDQTR